MTFSRSIARQTVIRQPVKPVAWRNSSRVASGSSRTAARRDSAASPWIKGLRPPRLGSGAIEPVAALRAKSLRIHRAETENRSAICSWVPSPASTAFRTRSRRSIEYGTITAPKPSLA